MAKINENTAGELPLNDERKPETKKPRHVVIANPFPHGGYSGSRPAPIL